MRTLAALLLGLVGAGCALKSGTELQIGRKSAPVICFDGAPVRVLVHPACGVCGWSCLPDRWAPSQGATDRPRD
jgi:hypothetical protein